MTPFRNALAALFSLLLLLLLTYYTTVPFASATTYTVTTDGTAEGSPYSLSGALALAGAGDTIDLEDGTYTDEASCAVYDKEAGRIRGRGRGQGQGVRTRSCLVAFFLFCFAGGPLTASLRRGHGKNSAPCEGPVVGFCLSPVASHPQAMYQSACTLLPFGRLPPIDRVDQKLRPCQAAICPE